MMYKANSLMLIIALLQGADFQIFCPLIIISRRLHLVTNGGHRNIISLRIRKVYFSLNKIYIVCNILNFFLCTPKKIAKLNSLYLIIQC